MGVDTKQPGRPPNASRPHHPMGSAAGRAAATLILWIGVKRLQNGRGGVPESGPEPSDEARSHKKGGLSPSPFHDPDEQVLTTVS
jgi:hypothetical protein